MQRAGKSRVQFPTRSLYFQLTYPSYLTTVQEFMQTLIEMSTKDLPIGQGAASREADISTICEPIVEKMWYPRHLKKCLLHSVVFSPQANYTD
jgi:hypothetical protein